MKKEKIIAGIEIILIVGLFMLFSYLAQNNIDFFKGFIGFHNQLLTIKIVNMN